MKAFPFLAAVILLLSSLVETARATLKHLRQHGHSSKHKQRSARNRHKIDVLLPPPSTCPFYQNGTCWAALITKDDYACGGVCGLCAPLGEQCQRPCGSWTLKLRGTGGKFIRESIMLALFEKDAVTQPEGETLGHAMARGVMKSCCLGV